MALLPSFYLDTVVAIGIKQESNKAWIGTGFLYGKVYTEDLSKEKRRYQLWLITNKHVLHRYHDIYLKFSALQDSGSRDYHLNLIARNGRPIWVGHPDDDVDVAVVLINSKVLKDDDRRFSFIQSDQHTTSRDQMISEGITEGDKVFLLGFPMGLVDEARQYVICRSGSLARIRDYTECNAKTFLIDAFVFPGNSGGPVILCPSLVSISGTKSIDRANLIGIVKAYIPYKDVAVSQQTKKARIIFEENSGLAAVEPFDAIAKTVEIAAKRYKRRAARERKKKLPN